MGAPHVELDAGSRADVASRRASDTGFRRSRHRRRPASAPAPLSTPRIFVSSRRRRHPFLVVAVLVLFWAGALTFAVAAAL